MDVFHRQVPGTGNLLNLVTRKNYSRAAEGNGRSLIVTFNF